MRFFAAVAALAAIADLTEGVKLVRSPGSFDPSKEDHALGGQPIQRFARKGGKMMGKSKSGGPSPPSPSKSKSKSAMEPEECVSTLICYSEEDVELTASANTATFYSSYDSDYTSTSLPFGSICVAEDGSDVLVDITATTAYLFTSAEYGYDSIVEHTADFFLGVSLDGMDPVPAAALELSFADTGESDYENIYGLQFNSEDIRTSNTGKFLFPNVDAGSYQIEITLFILAAAGAADNSYREFTRASTNIVLGPHMITATVIDAEDFVCPAP